MKWTDIAFIQTLVKTWVEVYINPVLTLTDFMNKNLRICKEKLMKDVPVNFSVSSNLTAIRNQHSGNHLIRDTVWMAYNQNIFANSNVHLLCHITSLTTIPIHVLYVSECPLNLISFIVINRRNSSRS